MYICDAQNYTVNGSVVCFDKNGHYKFTIDAKGINPNSIVFTDAPYQELPDDPNNGSTASNCITKVFEYMPAAGQFVNELPPYEEGDDETTMCAKCLQRLEQGSLVSLGGFGGYITVGFDSPILNHTGNTISEYSAMHLTVVPNPALSSFPKTQMEMDYRMMNGTS